MTDAVLALDLGTSGAKAALIGIDGELRARAAAPYPTQDLGDGGVEQDPRDWIDGAREAIRECLRTARSEDAEALGVLALTGQMQDLVLLPSPRPVAVAATGPGSPPGSAAGTAALRPAVLYSDTRAQEDARVLRSRLPDWDERTGNRQDATSCAAMWHRLLRTEGTVTARTRAIVLGSAGYLAWALGCGAWSDPTTASAAGLLEADGTWSTEVCAAAHLPEQLLPALTREIGQVVGETGQEARDLLSLPPGLKIVLAPGDAGATTLGLVGLRTGADHVSLGTSGWLARVVDTAPAEAGASHSLTLPGTPDRLRISAVLAAGEAAAWAREAFLGGVDASRADVLLEEREARVGRGPTGLLALPAIHGERFPVRDAGLRAAVIGMDALTRGIDVYAAVLEGVAHALAHALDDAPGIPRSTAPLAVTGGGARSEPWMRILADVTGRPVQRLPGADAALHGCAIAGSRARAPHHGIRPLCEAAAGAPLVPDPQAVTVHAALHATHRRLYDLLPRPDAPDIHRPDPHETDRRSWRTA